MDVFGKRVLFRGDLRAGISDDARDRRGFRQTLLLYQEFKRAIAATAGWHLEHAGLLAFSIENRPDIQALQEGPTCDVFGEILDRDARLDPADIGLSQHELVKGNVT